MSKTKTRDKAIAQMSTGQAANIQASGTSYEVSNSQYAYPANPLSSVPTISNNAVANLHPLILSASVIWPK